MRWSLSATMILIPTVAFAQPKAEPPTVKLPKLIPAAEPVPALKYKLLPDLRDTTTGNALVLYYRAFSPEWQYYRKDPKQSETLDKALETPLEDLPTLDLRYLREFKLLREVDRAA